MKKLTYEKDGYAWKWYIKGDSCYYCTNSDGDGIFVVNYNRRQLIGTAQFSLHGLTDKSAKQKIHQWMKNYQHVLDEED